MKHQVARLRGLWIAPLPLLGLGSGWWEPALAAAATLTAAELVSFVRGSTSDSIQIQVRMICVLLIVLGSVPPFGVLHVLLSLAGAAQLVSGRCLLTAAVQSAPWNRTYPAFQTSPALACG